MTTRDKAMEWWRTKLFSDKQDLVKKYHPQSKYHDISTDPEAIETIYTMESVFAPVDLDNDMN